MSEIHPEKTAPGWVGHISREKAETYLEGKEVGTFVLRAVDEVSSWALSSLETANKEHLESCILTVVAPGKKIAEYFIVHTPQGWTFYRDDPNLRDGKQYHFSPTLSKLLDKIDAIAKKPLNI